MRYEIVNQTYLNLVKNIKSEFIKQEITLFRGRNIIKVVPFMGQELVIKSFKIPHIINKVAYGFLRDSKAKKSYENSLMIHQFVPKPIAYVEFRKFGFLFESYYICENHVYDFTIREVLTQADFPDKETVLKAFAHFTASIHDEGIEHLDYSPGNILIKKSNDSYEFKIIDVNRMQFKILRLEDRINNFSKLWAKELDLKIILKAYASCINIDEKEILNRGLIASQKHKDKKNFKKRLKGKPIVD